MNIIIATAELHPFAKAGGMADITSNLPLEWQKFGQTPIVILPKYKFIDTDHYGFQPTDLVLNVPVGNWTEFARLWYGFLPNSNVPVYLIENHDYFWRDNIYGDPNEYHDNDRRFIFFCRAIFEAAKALNFYPDIIHAHDYHTAFALAFLKTHYRHDSRFSNTAGVLTIHNLAYQGWFYPDRALKFAQFSDNDFYPGAWIEQHGMVNAMKTGIMFADKITTVSPTYANEIRTPEHSEGLQYALNQRGDDLIGVLNGVRYDEWSPEQDTFIYQKYGLNNLDIKRENKLTLLREWGLNDWDNLDMPLVGMVSRLAEQKGIDILQWKLEEYLATGQFRLILLGSGEPDYENYFRYLEWKYPGRALVHIGYNNTLSHRIVACSDFLLMPSRFEPCGLTQLYSLKYGTIPIVRSTGGLADTVFEYQYESGMGTGFVFLHYNADDMAYAVRRALTVYNNQPHWDIIRKNAMNQNFSSGKSALDYLKVFNWALEKVRGISY